MSRGNTLYVGGSGPGNYTRIQDAVNASSDGDTVFVYDDSSPYFEHVIILKALTLIGENKNTTVIDWENSGNVFTVNKSGVTITGFTITIIFVNFHTRGIAVNANNAIIKDNNVVNGCWGIYLHNSKNSVISDNTVSVSRFGVVLHGSNANIISHNYIHNCELNLALSEGSTNNNVINNTIQNCTSFGIILDTDSSDNLISGNIIYNNVCGITIYKEGNNRIVGNEILNNGHGIDVYNKLLLPSNFIEKNNFALNNNNAYFEGAGRIHWSQNYWEKPRLLPYRISGNLFYFDMYGCRFRIPWLNFDWHPAQKPYNITGMR